MNHRATESTETQKRLWRNARGLHATFVALLAFLCLPVQCAPKAILYICSASNLPDVFSTDRPALESLVRTGGTAVLTPGPVDSIWISSLLSGVYAHKREPRTRLYRDVLDVTAVVLDPPEDFPGGYRDGDRLLAKTMRACPGVPVISVGTVSREPDIENGPVRGRVPTWISVSSLHGRLSSDTTRTSGVVSNLDVAPTIVAMVTGKVPSGTAGHVIRSGPPEGLRHGLATPIAATIRLQKALGILEDATNPTDYVIAFGAIALIILGSLLSAVRGNALLKRWMQRTLLLAVAAPIGIAVSAGRQPDSQPVFFLLAGGIALVLLAAFVGLGRALSYSREDTVTAVLQTALGALCAYVIADVARGGLPLRLSPLANYYQTGVRFYGLGNEYGALFIAAFTLFGLISLQRSGVARPGVMALVFLGAWFTGCSLFIGWPSLGANMGGIIVALVTSGIAWYFVAQKSGIRLPWLWPLMAAFVCLMAVIATDVHSAHATHVGQFVAGATASSRLSILLNKLEMNVHLIISPAAWIIYLLAAAFAWYWWRRLGIVRRRTAQAYPWVALGIRAILYGGILALITKDTGVVMLGLMAAVAVGAGVMLTLEPIRSAPEVAPSEGQK